MDDDEYNAQVAKNIEDERQTKIAFDVDGIVKCLADAGKMLEEKRLILHTIGNKSMESKFIKMLYEKNLYGKWEDYVNDEDNANKSNEILKELQEQYKSSGGRRNKKHSTRRKKMRGKKTRKYRRKY